MKRTKIAAMAVVLVLLAGLLPGRVSGAEDFVFTAMENVFERDVKEDTMPFTSGGMQYVAYTSLYNISAVRTYYNTTLNQIIVYNLDSRLSFDLESDTTYDLEGNSYSAKAIKRNGTVFVPINLVCSKFGLSYSYITAGVIAPVIRVNSEEPMESNKYFVDRCSILMQTIYDNYEKSLKPQQTEQPDTNIPSQPDDEQPDRPDEAKTGYIMFQGEPEGAEDILSALDSYSFKAAFFIPKDGIEKQSENIRRIYSSGYNIGILLEGSYTSTEQLKADILEANELLKQVINTKTRLVCYDGGDDKLTEEQRELVISMGCRIWNENTDPYSARGSSLLAKVKAAVGTRQTVAIKLAPDEDTAEYMRRICSFLRSDNFSILSINEWTNPVNRSGETR